DPRRRHPHEAGDRGTRPAAAGPLLGHAPRRPPLAGRPRAGLLTPGPPPERPRGTGRASPQLWLSVRGTRVPPGRGRTNGRRGGPDEWAGSDRTDRRARARIVACVPDGGRRPTSKAAPKEKRPAAPRRRDRPPHRPAWEKWPRDRLTPPRLHSRPRSPARPA